MSDYEEKVQHSFVKPSQIHQSSDGDSVSKELVLCAVVFALIIVGMVVSFFVLSSVDLAGTTPPTIGERTAAFYSKIYMTMTFVFFVALFLNGAVRHSPIASWMMPGSKKIKLLSDQIAGQAKAGHRITDGQYQFMAGVATRNGLWVCGTLIFCGLVILKM